MEADVKLGIGMCLSALLVGGILYFEWEPGHIVVDVLLLGCCAALYVCGTLMIGNLIAKNGRARGKIKRGDWGRFDG